MAIAVVGFIIFVRYIVPYLQKLHVFGTSKDVEKISLKTILAVLLAASFLAAESGVDVILIVFVLGVVLSQAVEKNVGLRKDIEAIGFGFLTPFFFFSIGFSMNLIDYRGLVDDVLILTLSTFAITGIAEYYFSKPYLPKRAFNIAFLLNAPISVGFVAASIAYQNGLLDYSQYLVLIGAVFLSSFLGVALTRYPGKESEA